VSIVASSKRKPAAGSRNSDRDSWAIEKLGLAMMAAHPTNIAARRARFHGIEIATFMARCKQREIAVGEAFEFRAIESA
jgi:hypothetical protein